MHKGEETFLHMTKVIYTYLLRASRQLFTTQNILDRRRIILIKLLAPYFARKLTGLTLCIPAGPKKYSLP